jgi:hypothetical protein
MSRQLGTSARNAALVGRPAGQAAKDRGSPAFGRRLKKLAMVARSSRFPILFGIRNVSKLLTTLWAPAGDRYGLGRVNRPQIEIKAGANGIAQDSTSAIFSRSPRYRGWYRMLTAVETHRWTNAH